jgi:hypothetical protein
MDNDVLQSSKGIPMNRKTLAAALVLVAAAGSALADDITIDSTSFVSTRSRAEVLAELQQFKAAGVNPWSQSFDQLKSFKSAKTRAQVTADYVDSREQTAATTGEDSGAAWLAANKPAAVPVLAGQPVNAQ